MEQMFREAIRYWACKYAETTEVAYLYEMQFTINRLRAMRKCALLLNTR